MKHILGMAKGYTDLKGARSKILELDYLRLVYAVKDLTKCGDNAHGYLVVLTENIRGTVQKWRDKYQGEGFVTVIAAPQPPRVMARLKQEKEKNRAGNIPGKDPALSIGDYARDIGEKALRKKIRELEPRVKELGNENKLPCAVRWDFYGIVK